MDPRQAHPSPRLPSSSSSSSQHLRPPPHHRPSAPTSGPGSSTSSTTSNTTSSTPRPPPAKISADPSATISDSAYFAGPHQITIGKGVVIHPRTRICATEGPVRIAEGCIVCEKAVVGTYPPPQIAGSGSKDKDVGREEGKGEREGEGNDEKNGIVFSENVTIGLQTLVHPGVRIGSGAVVDNQIVVGRGAEVGAHAKVCARCELLPRARVKEWTVVFGGGKGAGVRVRRKGEGKVVSPFIENNADGDGKGTEGLMEGRVVEDARLLSLRRERDALARLIVGVKRK